MAHADISAPLMILHIPSIDSKKNYGDGFSAIFSDVSVILHEPDQTRSGGLQHLYRRTLLG